MSQSANDPYWGNNRLIKTSPIDVQGMNTKFYSPSSVKNKGFWFTTCGNIDPKESNKHIKKIFKFGFVHPPITQQHCTGKWVV